MEFSADLNGFDQDSIEPCRTCGIYFTMGLDMDEAIVKPIFGLNDAAVGGMAEIIEQLSAWNIQVMREDGRPQYMCISCIAEFHRLLKFRQSCLETQEQFSDLEYQREHGIVIKREIESEEEKFCGFIYLDTDEEEISDEDGSRRVCAAFDIPHVPIKEEHMARVPVQGSPSNGQLQPPESKELGSFDMIDNDMLTANMFAPSSEDASGTADDGDTAEEEEEEEVLRFTYDDEGEDMAPLPPPILSPVVSCKLCLHESPTQDAHLDHMYRTHLLKDWECHICAKKFTNAPESRIKFHIKYHKLQRHIKCPVCGFICTSKATLKEHKQAVHSRTKCTYCGKTIKNNMLQGHLKKHLLEGEAELAQKLKLLEQLPVDNKTPEAFPPPLASSSLVVFSEDTESSFVTDASTVFTDSDVPEDSAFPKDNTASEDSTVPKEPVLPMVSATPTDVPYPMDANPPIDLPASVASPPSLPSPCVIQCAFCSDTFEAAQQLQAHVLANHKTSRKRLRSSEDPSSRRMASPKFQPSPIPMESEQPSDDLHKENNADLDASTFQINGIDQQESRNEVSLNDSSMSSTAEQLPEKSYIACHICGRTFDLKIKLNRHLKQHNTHTL
ncbi:zinc finger protein Helios [Drosophila elegans]|uniref:zinc finger protein Helios n=1 Tax=Drosophila elegans TaxID=30023 RepID=UPI0007E75869|nr:zinc finger protein Helios [Drosophila elegans]